MNGSPRITLIAPEQLEIETAVSANELSSGLVQSLYGDAPNSSICFVHDCSAMWGRRPCKAAPQEF
jgi:hypothetical protein